MINVKSILTYSISEHLPLPKCKDFDYSKLNQWYTLTELLEVIENSLADIEFYLDKYDHWVNGPHNQECKQLKILMKYLEDNQDLIHKTRGLGKYE